MLVQDLCWNEV